ncbi:glycosyltransferase [Pisciglobus halotolerans]|uniref:Glycosyl transferases group 1 n=1 Tax=Pisciglobus halotolerans TaxID=745365 RepID=A0A1I3AVM6_9LACT|nr:glycosyltransferase [Pisciglobus halotolerans]SFH54158.1 Glycosyl transferases group 1 [Pisciglobus halotolerans]
MNILFVGQNLQQGGVQIALINTLKELVKQQHTIDLFLFGTGDYTAEIPPEVNFYQGTKGLQLVATPYHKLAQKKGSVDYWYRIGLTLGVRMRDTKRFYAALFKRQKALGSYDVAISYFTDVPYGYFNQGTNQYVADFVNARQKIAWIHNDPFEGNFEVDHCRQVYENFDRIVCVSEACAVKFRKFLPEYAAKVGTVYNFFPLEEIVEKAQRNHRSECVEDKGHLPNTEKSVTQQEAKDRREIDLPFVKLVTVARIDNQQKRLDRILTVVKKLTRSGINNFHWEIIGEGPDLERNREQVRLAELDRFILYRGSLLNPYPAVAQSDLFVLTSQYEGYPMVVNEALILGVPVVTTPYAAAEEQIFSGYNGLITKMDTEDLYQQLKDLLEHPEKTQQFKTYIQQNPLDNQMALQQLENVLEA